MPKVIGPVKKRGTGRADYSTNVEISTVPVIRSYEEEYTYQTVDTIPAGSAKVIPVADKIPGKEYFIYEIYASGERNVLMRTALWHREEEKVLLHTTGYQNTEIKCVEGTGLGEINIKIWNYDKSKDLTIALALNGMIYPTKYL